MRVLPYINTFGGSQNGLITKRYMQFGDRPGRFRSAPFVPTRVGGEVSAVIAPRAPAYPQRQRLWVIGPKSALPWKKGIPSGGFRYVSPGADCPMIISQTSLNRIRRQPWGSMRPASTLLMLPLMRSAFYKPGCGAGRRQSQGRVLLRSRRR